MKEKPVRSIHVLQLFQLNLHSSGTTKTNHSVRTKAFGTSQVQITKLLYRGAPPRTLRPGNSESKPRDSSVSNILSPAV